MKYQVTSGFVHENGDAVDVGDIVEFAESDPRQMAIAKHYMAIGRLAEIKTKEEKAAAKPASSKSAGD